MEISLQVTAVQGTVRDSALIWHWDSITVATPGRKDERRIDHRSPKGESLMEKNHDLRSKAPTAQGNPTRRSQGNN